MHHSEYCKSDFPQADGNNTIGCPNRRLLGFPDSFAEGKWCQNIIMPKAVTEIGANAFFKSHVKYLETYATKIGLGAFTGTENQEGAD